MLLINLGIIVELNLGSGTIFYPCLSAGLAYYIALKRAPERVQMLKAVYEEEMRRAIDEDRDRASFQITPSLGNYRIV